METEEKALEVLQSEQTLIIDEQSLAQVEVYGYPRDYIVRCLNNNELNYASTSYYLLQNKHSLIMNSGGMAE